MMDTHEILTPEALIQMVKENDISRLEDVLEVEENIKLMHDTKDWSGDGLLAIACYYERLEIAILLIDKYQIAINSKNRAGVTPLHRACSVSNLDLVRLLCDRGADIFTRDINRVMPGDLGNDIVQKEIKSRSNVYQELFRSKLEDFKDADKEWDLQEKQSEIQKLISSSVPIYITGCSVSRLNGKYFVQNENESHCFWPVYRQEADPRLRLLYLPQRLPKPISWIAKESLENSVTTSSSASSPSSASKLNVSPASASSIGSASSNEIDPASGQVLNYVTFPSGGEWILQLNDEILSTDCHSQDRNECEGLFLSEEEREELVSIEHQTIQQKISVYQQHRQREKRQQEKEREILRKQKLKQKARRAQAIANKLQHPPALTVMQEIDGSTHSPSAHQLNQTHPQSLNEPQQSINTSMSLSIPTSISIPIQNLEATKEEILDEDGEKEEIEVDEEDQLDEDSLYLALLAQHRMEMNNQYWNEHNPEIHPEQSFLRFLSLSTSTTMAPSSQHHNSLLISPTCFPEMRIESFGSIVEYNCEWRDFTTGVKLEIQRFPTPEELRQSNKLSLGTSESLTNQEGNPSSWWENRRRSLSSLSPSSLSSISITPSSSELKKESFDLSHPRSASSSSTSPASSTLTPDVDQPERKEGWDVDSEDDAEDFVADSSEEEEDGDEGDGDNENAQHDGKAHFLKLISSRKEKKPHNNNNNADVDENSSTTTSNESNPSSSPTPNTDLASLPPSSASSPKPSSIPPSDPTPLNSSRPRRSSLSDLFFSTLKASPSPHSPTSPTTSSLTTPLTTSSSSTSTWSIFSLLSSAPSPSAAQSSGLNKTLRCVFVPIRGVGLVGVKDKNGLSRIHFREFQSKMKALKQQEEEPQSQVGTLSLSSPSLTRNISISLSPPTTPSFSSSKKSHSTSSVSSQYRPRVLVSLVSVMTEPLYLSMKKIESERDEHERLKQIDSIKTL